MQFATYTAFRNAVLRLIDGDDTSGSIHTDTLDLLIALGESRVYAGEDGVPGLRTRDMQAPLALTITNGVATLPPDCIELTSVQVDGRPLDYLPENTILRDHEATGPARYYTQQGGQLRFYPSTSGTCGGRYYARPFDIADALNPVFNRYPECFLYAALAEAAPFIGEDDRLPMWKQQWAGWMRQANTTERNVATSGGRLTVRSR